MLSASRQRPPLPVRALVLVALVLACAPAGAQQQSTTLSISVVEDQTGRPVSGARVELEGMRAVLTDRLGRARVRRIPFGPRTLVVSHIAFATERISIDFSAADAEAEIRLVPQVIELAGVEVTVTGTPQSRKLAVNGFYERQKMGGGAFLTRDQIMAQHAIRTHDLFRRVRGFRVQVDRRGEAHVVNVRNGCRPQVYLDGLLLSPQRGSDPLDIVRPEHIEGIEAYASLAWIPAEYNITGSACGVVLIWTRG